MCYTCECRYLRRSAGIILGVTGGCGFGEPNSGPSQARAVCTLNHRILIPALFKIIIKQSKYVPACVYLFTLQKPGQGQRNSSFGRVLL